MSYSLILLHHGTCSVVLHATVLNHEATVLNVLISRWLSLYIGR